jgi:RNA polymerase sigma-70 factor (ECF subfamily)
MPNTSEQTSRNQLEAAFEAHRRELYVHCYRMTGSLADAEDLTQEVFVRAWRNVDQFDRRASLRTWLYRIATNACIDFLRSHQRRAQPTASVEETLEREAWIDPYPDRADPAEQITALETTRLYLMAALMHLPTRQRAALIARDLLELDARDAAAVLDSTPTAVNSLLQRARRRLRELGVTASPPPIPTSDDDVIRTYIDAHERGDTATIVSLLAADVRITMPPEQPCHGIAQARDFFEQILGPDGPGVWELTYGRANGTHATVNSIRPTGDDTAQPISVDLIITRGGKISAIHCFLAPTQVRSFIDLAARWTPTGA